MSSLTYRQSPEIDSLLDDLHYSINSQHPGPHPWLSDLTSLALMLEGQLELPHGKEVKTTSMRFGQIVINNVAAQPFFDSNCHHCIQAYDRQQEYKSQKLLLKESDECYTQNSRRA